VLLTRLLYLQHSDLVSDTSARIKVLLVFFLINLIFFNTSDNAEEVGMNFFSVIVA